MVHSSPAKINWKWGWINHTQLPIIFKASNAAKACFTPWMVNCPRSVHPEQILLCRTTPTLATTTSTTLPKEYTKHDKVFSEEKSQRLPKHTIWDHTIKLLPGAPTTMPGWLLPLNQKEIKEVHKSYRNISHKAPYENHGAHMPQTSSL